MTMHVVYRVCTYKIDTPHKMHVPIYVTTPHKMHVPIYVTMHAKTLRKSGKFFVEIEADFA